MREKSNGLYKVAVAERIFTTFSVLDYETPHAMKFEELREWVAKHFEEPRARHKKTLQELIDLLATDISFKHLYLGEYVVVGETQGIIKPSLYKKSAKP